MIGLTFHLEENRPDRTKKASDTATLNSLSQVGFAVRQEAIATIETSPEPSVPGAPIHTRKGLARRAVRYAVDKAIQSVVIGPRASVVGESISPHEHGGIYKGTQYPPRPTMAPALERLTPRLGPTFEQG